MISLRAGVFEHCQETLMKGLLQTIGLVGALFVLAVVLDQFTPLKQLAIYLAGHPDPYRGIAVGMAIVGWALLIGAFVLGIIGQGRPMSEEEAKAFMSTRAGSPRRKGTFRGKAAGREFRMAATFREIKDTVRTGNWRHDPSWWPILIGLVGLPLAAYGMFGYFVVIGQPLVKLLCAGALAYATVRTVWGFWRA
jgi:hypothetical protein